MPFDPDEIGEIKKLLDNSLTNPASSPEKPKTDRPDPPSPEKPKTDRPDPPAVRQKPATPQAKPVSGPPSVHKKPEPPQKQQPPRVPAVPKNGAESIAARQRKEISTDNERGKIRSYDISADGVVSEKKEPKSSEPELDTGSEKFKVKFDFESAYRDVPENRPLRRRREKRTGCVGGILYAAFVICVSLVLASLVWMAAVDVLGFGEANEQVDVTVQPGFKMEDVTDMLYDAGLIRYKFLFNIYASYSKAETKITAGSYILNKSFDYRALVQGMTARAGARVETTVTIPEGYTLAQIFKLLEDHGVCSAADLWEAATNHDFNYSFLDKSTLGDKLRLEGFMFPETYNFYIGSTPVQAITKFLSEFNSRFTEQYTERAAEMGYSIKDIITVASMIEREAGNDEERPRIAAVIYNRLASKDFPYLQIDATINYAIAGTNNAFSTDYDSPYNTYLNKGLPPGPIANPGIASIRAALYPDTTKEYFYALNKSGSHNFFRTLAEHDAFVKSDEYGGR